MLIGRTLSALILIGLSSIVGHAQSNLLSGSWSTNNLTNTTVIMRVPRLTTPKVIAISTTSIAPTDTTYEVIVDGVIVKSLWESSTMIVEAHESIVIRRIVLLSTPAPVEGMAEGTWSLIQEAHTPAATYAFSFIPNLSTVRPLELKTPQHFVFSLNAISGTSSCPTGWAVVTQDGKVVVDDGGREVLFPRGSSYWSIAKSVTANLRGACPSAGGYHGSIKLKQ